MGLIKILREGSWSLRSKQDPRWNCSGRGLVGGLCEPPDATRKMEELKQLYGDPPDDLEWSYMKD